MRRHNTGRCLPRGAAPITHIIYRVRVCTLRSLQSSTRRRRSGGVSLPARARRSRPSARRRRPGRTTATQSSPMERWSNGWTCCNSTSTGGSVTMSCGLIYVILPRLYLTSHRSNVSEDFSENSVVSTPKVPRMKELLSLMLRADSHPRSSCRLA